MKCDQLKNGTWECVADGPRDPVTNKRNQVRRRGKSKTIAKKKVEDEIERQKNHGVNSKKNKNVTFESVAWEWLGVYALTGVKDSTIRNRTSSVKVLLRYIAQSNIAKIDTRQMQKIFVDLFEQDLSRSLLENAKVTANSIFKYAMEHKLRIDNPVVAVVIPKKRLTVEEIENTTITEKFFERHELEEFLEKTLTDGLPLDKEWFYLLAFTGMRVGELCALKWTDVNFETNEIRITKTMDMPDHNMRKFKVTPPKTKASIRTIDVDEDIISMLKSYKVNQSKIKLGVRKGIEDYHEGNFVFARQNGYPYASRFIYDRIIRLLKKTSIKKIEGPHILRHTHITMLTEAGVDLKTIMDRVGHDDSKTTMDIYTHVTEKMKEDATEKIKNRYGDILKMTIPKGKVIEM
ncbi:MULTISPECIES: tyrosine-type recombinase/integrase [Sporosarcina]|uniref:Pathogenicity island protein n=1 Tax=Sporosarcina newyorkensis 2681 TaxID=1027292 RepID=F9DX80_9BACL|nr:site-specific integrase [Sporosarcina newyorkensis]EGQ21128.1 pathogenicity island protein [Sporosarcina newyorkensis 2681]